MSGKVLNLNLERCLAATHPAYLLCAEGGQGWAAPLSTLSFLIALEAWAKTWFGCKQLWKQSSHYLVHFESSKFCFAGTFIVSLRNCYREGAYNAAETLSCKGIHKDPTSPTRHEVLQFSLLMLLRHMKLITHSLPYFPSGLRGVIYDLSCFRAVVIHPPDILNSPGHPNEGAQR